MNIRTKKMRVAVLTVVFIVVILLFSLRMMQLQVVEGENLANQIEQGWTNTQVIKAARGEIFDRNGRPLAVNTIGRDVVINMAYMEVKNDEAINHVVERLIAIMEQESESWIDNLPLTDTTPFRFLEGDAYEDSVARLKRSLKLEQYATVDDVVYWLKKNYKLEEVADEALFRKIAGVRYEMEQRGFSVPVPYTFATDIRIETVPKIKERSFELPGVDVVESPVRQYVSGDIAPHLIGSMGPIYKEQWQAMKKTMDPATGIVTAVVDGRTYSMNDVIGNSGSELAFEKYLKGVDGERKILCNSRGDVIDVVEEQAMVPGNSVVLTIDAQLQKVMQDALENKITTMQQTYKAGEGREVNAGAAVAVDVKTGEILAAATYPSYDLSTYQEDYPQLRNAYPEPLFNRAFLASYRPGSTFKPAVALTSLSENVITRDTHITCNWHYTRFDDYQPYCEGTHGPVNVINAIRGSCNIFFYESGWNTGIDAIDRYAAAFGMGEPTGLELTENVGQVASPSLKEKLHTDDPVWRPGDVLQASIGQGDTMLSPLQLANYTATLANNGKRMKTTILKSVKTYGLDGDVYEHTPEVAATVDAPQEDFDIVREGMVAVSRVGTARGTFANYPVDVASKTGSPQTPGGINSVFIAYAPADDPQVAVAVVLEKGWEGYTGAPVAKEFFDAYFYSNSSKTSAATDYGALLS